MARIQVLGSSSFDHEGFKNFETFVALEGSMVRPAAEMMKDGSDTATICEFVIFPLSRSTAIASSSSVKGALASCWVSCTDHVTY